MRKLTISILLVLLCSYAANTQVNDQIAWRIVDSLNKEIKKAKKEKLVDCYNLLAECYFWIWDENDKHLDTAKMYTNIAFSEAKKINYKPGIGFAKAALAHYAIAAADRDRSNNDREQAYIDAYKIAAEVLKYASELKNNYLSGLIYYHLAWKEKWAGTQDKFKANTQKAIEHFNKVQRKDLTTGYTPLFFFNCASCKGTEAVLAHLHYDLASIYIVESDPQAKQEMDLAAHYHDLVGKKLSFGYALGNAFLTKANLYYQSKNYKLAETAFLESIKNFHDAGRIEEELTARNELCKTYEIYGDFEKGIATSKSSIELIENYFKNNPGSATRRSAGQAFFWMSRLYKIAGDFEGALQVIRTGKRYYPIAFDSGARAPWMAEIGDVHRLLGNYDSAMFYLKDFQNSDNNPNNFGKMHLGYLYNDLKQYSKALSLILPYYQNLKKINRITPPIAQTLMIASNASLGRQEYEQALNYASEAQTHLLQMDGRMLMITNYKLLSDIYSKLNKPDSAYKYLSLHTRLKDSLITRQFYFKLNSVKNESEEQKKTGLIQLLQKDNVIKEQLLQEELLRKKQNEAELALLDQNNKIKDQELLIKEQNLKEQTLLKDQNLSRIGLLDKENKLKDQRLKQQATIRNALLAGLLLFLALGIFVFRNLSLKRKNERLQNEKRQAELQQKASELEMQALRAQMNPHFIFNCLSSINKFVLKNDTDAASDYLTRFSRLIRHTLTNSQLSLIPLSDEIEMLRLYLDMERLRFSDSFIYNITYENSIEPETVYVPPMLLQPFCENAIWHGLMHKEGPGKLEIVLSLENGQLRCIIADNGIGREKAAELKTKLNGKQKSFGLKITTERLALFNNEKATHDFYKTEDVLDANGDIAGTKVVLNIKIKNSTYQPAKEAV